MEILPRCTCGQEILYLNPTHREVLAGYVFDGLAAGPSL